MTRFDKLVITDLAALSADSRQQLPAVADVLQVLLSSRTGKRSELRHAEDSDELALMSLANLFAHRVGRAAAGAMGVVCTLALLVALYGPGVDLHTGFSPWWWVLEHDTVSIVIAMAALMLAAYAFAASIARRRFERTLGGESAGGQASSRPDEVALRSVRSVDGWSVGFAIAGVTCVGTLVGVITSVVGWDGWHRFWCLGCERVDPVYTDRLHDLTIVVPGIVVAALVLGRACVRPRWSRWAHAFGHPVVVLAGLALGAATLYIGFTLDIGPRSWSNEGQVPSSELRTALTVAGALAVFLVIAGVSLRRRAREREQIAARYDAACKPGIAERELVTLASVFEHQVARMAGGIIAVVHSVVLLVVIHDPFANRPLHGEQLDGIDGRVPWRELLFHDRVSMMTQIALLVFAAHIVGAHLAGRMFERRVRALAIGNQPRDLVEVGRRLVQRVDGLAVAFGIGGVTLVITVFAVIGMTVGGSYWVFFQVHGPRSGSAVAQALRDVVIASALSLGAAFAIGRACVRESHQHRRSRWLGVLEHRRTVPIGLVVGFVQGLVGATLDFGIFDISLPAVERPSLVLETVLTVMCVAAALLITTGYTLRRRRAEHERIGIVG